jgi:catechol 2,3-dioxygenase-like lactoylglutathione lyase family enzyme
MNAASAASSALRRADAPVARAQALLYVHLERPDPELAAAFLADFGLAPAGDAGGTRYFRGVGPAPFIYKISPGRHARLLGFGMAASAPNMRALSAHFAVPIEKNTDPGGGEVIRLRDPDGVAIDILCGQDAGAPLPARASIQHNAPDRTVRVNDTQRPPLEAPQIRKFGHLVLGTPHFERAARWYIDKLGLIPSDVLCLPDGTPAGAFMRLDKGDEPADHHTVFIALGVASELDHLAFEVADLDAVEMGQQVLKARGYRHAWGVGRHLLGSQIFDYWRDPWGQKHEHYADGDLLDSRQPAGYHPLGKQGLYQWGPDLPEDFLDTRLTPRRLFRLLKGVATGAIRLAPLIAAQRSMRAPGRPWQK